MCSKVTVTMITGCNDYEPVLIMTEKDGVRTVLLDGDTIHNAGYEVAYDTVCAGLTAVGFTVFTEEVYVETANDMVRVRVLLDGVPELDRFEEEFEGYWI